MVAPTCGIILHGSVPTLEGLRLLWSGKVVCVSGTHLDRHLISERAYHHRRFAASMLAFQIM